MRNEMIRRTRPTKLGKRRILVVATETLGGATLHDVLGAHGESPAQVLVIAPALNSRLRWLSDEDGARRGSPVSSGHEMSITPKGTSRMLIHPSVHLAIACQRQQAALAQAERHRVAEAHSSATQAFVPEREDASHAR